MSQTTDGSRFASLFVDVTGCDTITEAQRADDAERFADDADRDVADYVADASREDGLEDAIDAADDALAD